jgi:hypothetical protein
MPNEALFRTFEPVKADSNAGWRFFVIRGISFIAMCVIKYNHPYEAAPYRA